MACAMVLSGLYTGTYSAQAEEITTEEECCCDGCLLDEEDYGIPDTRYEAMAQSRAVLPSKVDLSTSPCFPPIGDQGKKGSCASFATTYYQYSYEVNRLNNVTNIADQVTYSPTWTYNLANSGVLNADGGTPGTSHSSNTNVLKYMGCLTLDDLPYNKNIKEDFADWTSDLTDEKRKALEISCETYSINISCSSNATPIKNTSSTKLQEIKSALNDGKVLTIVGPAHWDEKKGYGKDASKMIQYQNKYHWSPIASECMASIHARTIVGYDDTICCDINGNGIIESAEQGAFKVANLWGTLHGDSGYDWVLYDALNYKSAVNGFTNSSNRVSAFSTGHTNQFYYMDVNYCEPKLIAQVEINTPNRDYINPRYDWYDYAHSTTPVEHIFGIPNSSSGASFEGTFLFAISSGDDNLKKLYKDDAWDIQISDIPTTESNTSYVRTKIDIIDDKGNIILPGQHSFDSEKEIDLEGKLQIGDVNYDGKLDASDANLMMDFAILTKKFSRVQGFLADYNGDGIFNLLDVTAFKKYLSANGLATTSELTALQTRMAKCLQDETILETYSTETIAMVTEELSIAE